MALGIHLTDMNGVLTAYHKISRVMVNYSGEGSIEIALAHYVDSDIRLRQKSGEICGSVSETNIYLALGSVQSHDRAVLYPRLKAEAPEYFGAEDIIE